VNHMRPQPDGQCPASRYLARTPEILVVGGYRAWLHFAIEQNAASLETIQAQFNRHLGKPAAFVAMAGLESMIRQLGTCASCPLRCFCQGSQHLCRDECLILGLVSGLQNGEDEAAYLSAGNLSSNARAPEVVASAGEFAMALKFAGQQLLPIPVDTLHRIIKGGQAASNPTLH
jgi:hypothetical protein